MRKWTIRRPQPTARCAGILVQDCARVPRGLSQIQCNGTASNAMLLSYWLSFQEVVPGVSLDLVPSDRGRVACQARPRRKLGPDCLSPVSAIKLVITGF